MISRKTRASGLLRQLSRARPMIAAELVVESQAHAARQSQHMRACEKCLLRPFTSGVVFRSIIMIEKSPGVMMKYVEWEDMSIES